MPLVLVAAVAAAVQAVQTVVLLETILRVDNLVVALAQPTTQLTQVVLAAAVLFVSYPPVTPDSSRQHVSVLLPKKALSLMGTLALTHGLHLLV